MLFSMRFVSHSHFTGFFFRRSRDEFIQSILDHCKTTQGHRLLKQWIRQPFIAVNKIGMIIAVCTGLCMYLSNRAQY
mgnify:CR=1 FL=1